MLVCGRRSSPRAGSLGAICAPQTGQPWVARTGFAPYRAASATLRLRRSTARLCARPSVCACVPRRAAEEHCRQPPRRRPLAAVWRSQCSVRNEFVRREKRAQILGLRTETESETTQRQCQQAGESNYRLAFVSSRWLLGRARHALASLARGYLLAPICYLCGVPQSDRQASGHF